MLRISRKGSVPLWVCVLKKIPQFTRLSLSIAGYTHFCHYFCCFCCDTAEACTESHLGKSHVCTCLLQSTRYTSRRMIINNAWIFSMDAELNDERYHALVIFTKGITVPTDDWLWNTLANVLLWMNSVFHFIFFSFLLSFSCIKIYFLFFFKDLSNGCADKRRITQAKMLPWSLS